ncbi:MAG: hypothetical protein ACRC80_07540 [Waterburya sp.]
MSLPSFIKRFTMGAAIGLFVAAICWSYSAYFYVSVSLIQGVLASLLLAVTCGIVATLGNIDKLFDSLPFL